MDKLIKFAVNLMEKENSNSLDLPSKNSILNPLLNSSLNPEKESRLNPAINHKINPKINPITWKQCQLEVFKETPIYEYLTKRQKLLCLQYLKAMKA